MLMTLKIQVRVMTGVPVHSLVGTKTHVAATHVAAIAAAIAAAVAAIAVISMVHHLAPEKRRKRKSRTHRDMDDDAGVNVRRQVGRKGAAGHSNVLENGASSLHDHAADETGGCGTCY